MNTSKERRNLGKRVCMGVIMYTIIIDHFREYLSGLYLKRTSTNGGSKRRYPIVKEQKDMARGTNGCTERHEKVNGNNDGPEGSFL